MSHETHHQSDNKLAATPFKSSFWFVIILVGLFVAAVNFVNVMSHDDEGHGAGHGSTEAHAPAANGHDAHATEAAGRAAPDTAHAAH